LAIEVLRLTEPGRVLDAGSALNGHIQDIPLTASVTHLTQNIVSEKLYSSPRYPMSYVSGDIRDLRMYRNGAFDRTVCVSTLEHVGLDNTGYHGAVESSPASAALAVDELCRVTQDALLITVPYAEPPVRHPQWRFFGATDVAHLARTLRTMWNFRVDVRYYAKCDGGWYGGEPDPVPASPEGFPDAVNAIVCLRCVR
jgi:hypothetical protein